MSSPYRQCRRERGVAKPSGTHGAGPQAKARLRDEDMDPKHILGFTKVVFGSCLGIRSTRIGPLQCRSMDAAFLLTKKTHASRFTAVDRIGTNQNIVAGQSNEEVIS